MAIALAVAFLVALAHPGGQARAAEVTAPEEAPLATGSA